MKHNKCDNFIQPDKFDGRKADLKQRGFKENKVGMSDDKYSFLWHQIESPLEAEWQEFLKQLDK